MVLAGLLARDPFSYRYQFQHPSLTSLAEFIG